MTFACQDLICRPGCNLLCRLRLSKIICGQILEGDWYRSKWQMTATTGLSANVCTSEESACLFKCFPRKWPPACAQTPAGDPSHGSCYKAAGILRSNPADRWKEDLRWRLCQYQTRSPLTSACLKPSASHPISSILYVAQPDVSPSQSRPFTFGLDWVNCNIL